MALTTYQQIFKAIERSKNVLIAFRQHWSVDALASSLALAAVLRKMEKAHTVVASGFTVPAHLTFLSHADAVKPGLEALRKFLISLNLHGNEVEEFTYDIVEGKLVVSITPRRGFFNPEDVGTGSSEWRYDLVITVDTPDLDALGTVYTENAEFFYKTPVINIDHAAHNEHYGSINMVEVTSAATAEVIAQVLNAWDVKMLDETVATCLLAGITAETESFRLPSVTPQTLTLSSQLVSIGAQRELIVNNLYRTKTVDALKLWGRALARIKNDVLAQLVWSVIPRVDFERAGGTMKELAGVLDELMVAVPKTRLAALIVEDPGAESVRVYLRAVDRHLDARQLLAGKQAEGDRVNAQYVLPASPLAIVERNIVDELRAKLLNIRAVAI